MVDFRYFLEGMLDRCPVRVAVYTKLVVEGFYPRHPT